MCGMFAWVRSHNGNKQYCEIRPVWFFYFSSRLKVFCDLPKRKKNENLEFFLSKFENAKMVYQVGKGVFSVLHKSQNGKCVRFL